MDARRVDRMIRRADAALPVLPAVGTGRGLLPTARDASGWPRGRSGGDATMPRPAETLEIAVASACGRGWRIDVA